MLVHNQLARARGMPLASDDPTVDAFAAITALHHAIRVYRRDTRLPDALEVAQRAMAAEAVGIAQRVLELGIEHASTRLQFGKPIGVYQAVSHQLADTYADVELARSLVYWAAWCVAEDDEQAPIAAGAAKAFAAEAAVAACERSIQVHGGTGFTWEHPLHRFYKRALWLEGLGSRPSELRGEIADDLLGVTVQV
jgi:alkylation response protein AidB-like acyl-CoA dehydrogenase